MATYKTSSGQWLNDDSGDTVLATPAQIAAAQGPGPNQSTIPGTAEWAAANGLVKTGGGGGTNAGYTRNGQPVIMGPNGQIVDIATATAYANDPSRRDQTDWADALASQGISGKGTTPSSGPDFNPLLAAAGGFLGGALSGTGALSNIFGAAPAASNAAEFDAMAAAQGGGAAAADAGAAGAAGAIPQVSPELDPTGSMASEGAARAAGSIGTLPALPQGAEAAFQQYADKVGQAAATSVLGRLINGTATASDYADILGKIGAAGLQALGSANQSSALTSLAKQYQEYGAPSRARFEASMTPGFDPNSIPGYSGAVDSASKGILARLSAQGGNPFGNPTGLIAANKDIVSGTALPAVQEYQRLNANAGFGSSMNAALGLQTGAIGANNNVLAGVASGLGSVTAPDNSIQALLAQLRGPMLNTSGTALS